MNFYNFKFIKVNRFYFKVNEMVNLNFYCIIFSLFFCHNKKLKSSFPKRIR